MVPSTEMIYPRRILEVIYRLVATQPVVILEGPRTVGKSTLLREIATTSSVGIVDLDEPDIKDQVEADPQGYVTRGRPVLIDEYPKVPRLIQHIKAQLNKDGSPGQFVLTGSASLEANRPHLGALVGRYTDVLVLPLAQSEIGGREGNFMEEAFDDIEGLHSSGPSVTTRESYIQKVLTGGFPLLVRSLDTADRYQRFTDYVDQSINYGMANLYEIREQEYLRRLLHRYAAQTGQLLNIRGAARDVELKWGTAENYTRLLELLFLIHRLPAWKTTDRGPVSRPKLYVVDSGVGGRLLRLTTERVRSGEPLFLQQYGHLLETFVLGEVRKMLSWMDGPSNVGYWRNRRGDEVDLVVERPDDDAVIGLEVKAGSRVRTDDWKGLRILRDEAGPRFHAGLVMYTGEMPYRLDDNIYAIPIDKLWGGDPRATNRQLVVNRRAPDGGPLTVSNRSVMPQRARGYEFGAFLSYARSDDTHDGGRITALTKRLQAEISMQTGEPFPIFRDRDDIFIGQQWRARILNSVNGSTLLIAIITPSFLKSANCREEVERFIERERSLNRDDLIIPILYVHTPGLDSPQDDIAVELSGRQYFEWNKLRFEDMASNEVRREIDRLARQVIKAVDRSRATDVELVPAITPTDDVPGTLELIAEAEDAMPLFTETLKDLSALITETGSLTTDATREMKAAKSGPRSASARLIIVRRLAKHLERPVSEIEDVTENYLDHLARVDAGMNALIELVPSSVKTKDDIETARQLLGALSELAEGGRNSLDAIDGLRKALANNYRLSSTLRPVLRRMSDALDRVRPSVRQFETWRDRMTEALNDVRYR